MTLISYYRALWGSTDLELPRERLLFLTGGIFFSSKLSQQNNYSNHINYLDQHWHHHQITLVWYLMIRATIFSAIINFEIIFTLQVTTCPLCLLVGFKITELTVLLPSDELWVKDRLKIVKVPILIMSRTIIIQTILYNNNNNTNDYNNNINNNRNSNNNIISQGPRDICSSEAGNLSEPLVSWQQLLRWQ